MMCEHHTVTPKEDAQQKHFAYRKPFEETDQTITTKCFVSEAFKNFPYKACSVHFVPAA